MTERNIKLLVAYDGTDFSGWQRQENARTVQGEIEAALETIHKKHVSLTGAGRTDAGVHAAGQTANFLTGIASIPAASFVPALNSLLPRDVRVLAAAETRGDFHARFDAVSRTYRYFIIPGRNSFPWERRYAWLLGRFPRVSRLNSLASLLRGEMDCSMFAASGDKSRSRNRYIYNACFYMEGNRLVFEITANAFLWRMVRSVVGSLLSFEERAIAPEEAAALIASGERRLAGPTAPPGGLFLWKVDYGRE